MITMDDLEVGDIIQYNVSKDTNEGFWRQLGIISRIERMGGVMFVNIYARRDVMHYVCCEAIGSNLERSRFTKIE